MTTVEAAGGVKHESAREFAEGAWQLSASTKIGRGGVTSRERPMRGRGHSTSPRGGALSPRAYSAAQTFTDLNTRSLSRP